MVCPKCKTVYVCHCDSCKPRTHSTWTSRREGDLYFRKCPGCGFEQKTEDWFEESMNQYDKWEKLNPNKV